jgi:hypothetical protein
MNAFTKLSVGSKSNYHGHFYVENALGGVVANGFNTKEEALNFIIEHEIEENKKLMKKIDELLKK